MRVWPLLLLLLLAPPALAQIYSWRDAEGIIHYSDQAPPDVAATRKLESAPASSEEIDRARRKLAKEQTDFRKRQTELGEADAKAEKAQGEAVEREANCKQAKSYLQALESGARVSRANEKGEPIYLDDSGREQETIAARRAVSSWCN